MQDYSLNSLTWVDLRAALNIPAGSTVQIQNKAGEKSSVYISTEAIPDAGDNVGYKLPDTQEIDIAGFAPAIWVRGVGVLNVEYGTPSIGAEVGVRPVIVQDYAGRRSMNTLFGDAVVGWREDDVSVMFQYNIGTRDIKTVGTVTAANEMANITIGTGVETSSVTSIDTVRYRTGHEAIAQFTSIYEGIQSGVSHYHGLLNGADGACFGSQNGQFGVYMVAGSEETFYPQSSWNFDKLDGNGPSGFTLDPTKMNIYMVQYGWLGVAPILFSVYCGLLSGWRLVHYIDRVNTVTRPHLHNPTLPIQAKVVRASGTGTSAALRTASWRGGVVAGGQERSFSANRWNAYTVLDLTVAAAVSTNVFSIINNSTFQSKTNHVVVELGVATFDNAGNKAVAFYGKKGAIDSVLTGGITSSIDATNSVVSVRTGGTYVGGTRGPATVIKAGGDRRTDVLGTGIVIYPGEEFSFEVVPAAAFNGTVSVSGRWIERF